MKMRLIGILCAVLLLFGCGARKQTPAPAPEPAASAAPAEGEGGDASFGGAQLTGVLLVSGGEESNSGGAYASAEGDEIAVLIRDGGHLTLSGADVSKTGDTASPHTARETGCNAAVNTAAGASFSADGAIITTNALGATGVHVAGENAAASLQSTMIVTAGADSPALSALAGGAATALEPTFTAERADSPCVYLAGGSAQLTGGSLKSLLAPCAAFSGAGELHASGTALTGAVGIAFAASEGEAALADPGGETAPADPSGAGAALCALTGGSLTGTGTEALIVSAHPNACVRLSGAALNSASGRLLSVTAGALRLEADGQALEGLIEAAAETSCALSLTGGSVFTGAFLAEDQRCFSLSLDAASRVSLTEDSYIGALQNADASFANVSGNGFSLYYDSSLEANAWLSGKSFALANGGYLVPLI